MLFRRIFTRIYGLFFKHQVERDIDAELRFHIQMRAQENLRTGMTADDAQRDALKRFGNISRIKETCRDFKGGGLLETLSQDLQYGVRMMWKSPGFTIVAILTLALGIGANTAIFSIINAVLLQPLPYPESERIVQGYWHSQRGVNSSVTATEYMFWKEHSQAFAEVAGFGYSGGGFNLASDNSSQLVRGLNVSERFFRVLKVQPAIGRDFLSEEDRPNGPYVAIISDPLWRNYFGADANVIGKQVQLNGRSCTIVGVLPASFRFEFAVDVFTPLALTADANDKGHNTIMLARIKPDLTIKQAQEQVSQLIVPFNNQYPGHAEVGDLGVRLVPYHQSVVNNVSNILLLLFAAVGFVLLIACANVTNLLLSRGTKRAGEIAVRIALGASRLRLIRQLMTESLILALAGGLLAVILAFWCVPLLLALLPPELPSFGEVKLDLQVIVFAFLVSLITSLIFGIAPAWQATQLDINKSLKASTWRNSSTSRLGARLRRLLVISEVALSLVLLVMSALLIQSFLNMYKVDLGFDPNNLTTMQVSLHSANYNSTAQSWEFEKRVMERISALPGVLAVATVPSLPMERGLNDFITIEGLPEEKGILVESRPISPDYFRVLGITLLRGRLFNDNDSQTSTPVMVINQRLANHYWPDADPIGKQFVVGKSKCQIVGVVSDIREVGLDRPVLPTIYIPKPQLSDEFTIEINGWFFTSWIVRTSQPIDINEALRNIVKEIDTQIPVASIRPLTQVLNTSVAQQRFITTLIGIFASLAIVLTAIGLYGVLSYQVSQRTQEIGIRMALGAKNWNIIRLIVGEGVTLTLIGVSFGLISAVFLSRMITGLLFGVSSLDPLTFISISIFILVIAGLACLIPALRATRIAPIISLRYE
ncbi:MAG: ABC transporter permease [Acidobacteriota bacterium]